MLTSLPVVTSARTPTPMRVSRFDIAPEMAPDCAMMPTGPSLAPMVMALKVTKAPRDGKVNPSQFGPSRRNGALASRCSSAACSRRPVSPASAKPEVIEAITRTPLASHSSSAAMNPSAGTITTATSTGSGTSARRGLVGRPNISGAVRLIG